MSSTVLGQGTDCRGSGCVGTLFLVVVNHSLGLANCLGRMTLYPPRSFTATESHK